MLVIVAIVKHCQVGADEQRSREGRKPGDERGQLGVEFRRAAGDVHDGKAAPPGIGDHLLHGGGAHHLGALRPGLVVAVLARLVAAIANVDLKRLGGATRQRQPVGRDGLRQRALRPPARAAGGRGMVFDHPTSYP